MSCPICSKPTQAAYRPFCSKRCADMDLAKWLNGSYAVPSARETDPDEIAEAVEDLLRDGDGGHPKKPH